MSSVLIADDSASMRIILKDILLRNGYSVAAEAANGREAVQLYEQLRPDVAALDVSMPEMDGLDALKQIKNVDPDARIVMIASMGEQELVIEAIKAGASDFFIKPMQAERVLEALAKALK